MADTIDVSKIDVGKFSDEQVAALRKRFEDADAAQRQKALSANETRIVPTEMHREVQKRQRKKLTNNRILKHLDRNSPLTKALEAKAAEAEAEEAEAKAAEESKKQKAADAK